MARTRRTTITLLLLCCIAMGSASARAGSAAACPTAFRVVAGVRLGGSGELLGVASRSPTDVWAVGDYVTEGQRLRPLIEDAERACGGR